MKLCFGGSYAGRRVFVTGNTGFKGSWLTLWLSELGARVSGFSQPAPTTPSHHELLGLSVPWVEGDVRDGAAVRSAMAKAEPELVFHLAAQALVRPSYANPIETFQTNVLGTLEVLEACLRVPSVRGVVVVTSDKCYENREWPWPYRESDPLGGHDPYSASKAAAEIATHSFSRSFCQAPARPLRVASARAGNVVGGGDWAEERLVPDLIRGVVSGEPVVIRRPHAIRPWQHVLDALSGYLLLGWRLLEGGSAAARAFNFGPASEATLSVVDVARRFANAWPALVLRLEQAEQGPHEAQCLQLDSSCARQVLGWRPVWSVDEALRATAAWYGAWQQAGLVTSLRELAAFTVCAEQRGAVWA